jgi:hypothetical protein
MHEIERVADESTSGSEHGQRAHRDDKQARPLPLNVSTAYLLNIFFGPASTVQRFNGSRHRRLNVKCSAQPAQSLLAVASGGRRVSGLRRQPNFFSLG